MVEILSPTRESAQAAYSKAKAHFPGTRAIRKKPTSIISTGWQKDMMACKRTYHYSLASQTYAASTIYHPQECAKTKAVILQTMKTKDSHGTVCTLVPSF
jgi:hypothetical protein